MRKQYIYIGINECISAVEHKDRLEALAFALMIKLTFVDSIVKSTSIRQLTYIFRMGWTRLSRVLNNALYYGYVVKEGYIYFVPRLKQRGSFNKRLEYAFVPFSKTEDGRSAYRLNGLMKDIRKVVFKNHIKKQTAFCDTALSVNSPCDNTEYKRSRGRLKRMCGIVSVSNDMLASSKRLSIKRAMQVMGTSRSMTKRLIKQMIANGEITRSFENIPVSMNYKELEKGYAMQQAVYRANEFGGYLHIWRDAVYIQTANHYALSDKETNSFTYSPRLK